MKEKMLRKTEQKLNKSSLCIILFKVSFEDKRNSHTARLKNLDARYKIAVCAHILIEAKQSIRNNESELYCLTWKTNRLVDRTRHR
jgi:hypothetical protein